MAISGGSKKAAVQKTATVTCSVKGWSTWARFSTWWWLMSIFGMDGWENMGKLGKTWENMGTHLQISVENLGNHTFSELRHPMTPGSMDFGYSATLQTIQGYHPHDKANFKSTSGGWHKLCNQTGDVMRDYEKQIDTARPGHLPVATGDWQQNAATEKWYDQEGLQKAQWIPRKTRWDWMKWALFIWQ